MSPGAGLAAVGTHWPPNLGCQFEPGDDRAIYCGLGLGRLGRVRRVLLTRPSSEGVRPFRGLMSIRPDPHPVRDFFIEGLIDYAPKDSSEMMERPFFSISKRKRNKPIHYATPDGKLWIKVNANPVHGMATIWDSVSGSASEN